MILTVKRLKFNKYSFELQECLICQTVYLSPRPTPKIISDFLSNSKNYQYWAEVIFPASEKVRRAKIFVPRVNKVIEICRQAQVPFSQLVEVGSGYGTFLEELAGRHLFTSLVGIEPSTKWAQICRRKGLRIIEKMIEEFKPRELSAQVVVCFEVIEHLFSPQEFILSCRKILAKNGLLILTCPNVHGFDVQVLGVKSDVFDGEHLNYFHPGSLQLLVKECGFRVVDLQTPGELDVDIVRNKVLTGKYKIKDHFLNSIVTGSPSVRAGFQRFLQENLLSSNMWLVARKK